MKIIASALFAAAFFGCLWSSPVAFVGLAGLVVLAGLTFDRLQCLKWATAFLISLTIAFYVLSVMCVLGSRPDDFVLLLRRIQPWLSCGMLGYVGVLLWRIWRLQRPVEGNS